MKWIVEFKQEHKNCCPPRTAWVLRTETVDADSAEQAQQLVEHAWRHNKHIVVTKVKELNNEEKQQGE